MEEGQIAPRFAEGAWVQDRNHRSFVGQVVRPPTRANGTYWYEIRTQTGRRSTRVEAALVPHEPEPDPEDLFISSSFGDQEDLVRLLTFRKLNRPLHDTLYSLGASRTEFHPHQFKPLVKFLDSQNQRLLLADEVGLGKTIEAGLILIEQRARDAVDHVLVICPASLTLKWKQEMWERFDEEFDILSAADFRRLHERWTNEGPPIGFRGIISLQSFRSKDTIDRLSERPLHFDLVIVDEAHHLRNPETLSHHSVRTIVPEARAALFLSATPIQLGNENLYYLLRLLSPGEFTSLEIFQERLQANEPIVLAERVTRAGPNADVEEIREQLERARRIQPSYFDSNPIFQRARSELEEKEELTMREAVHLQADLRELNLLGRQICRSLRRDVFENAPVRKAHVYSAELTPAEEEFYDAVTDFVRSKYRGRSNIGYLVAVQAQRQVASCMPAARDRFLSRAWGRLEDPEEMDLQDELELAWEEAISDRDQKMSPPERVIDAANALGSTDSKFEKLLEALEVLYEEEPEAKVLLFSYFKDTLRYLHRRLEDAGFRCNVIHGDVRSGTRDPEKDERRRRMREFRDPESGVQILLSSEVGSEGLDFQFCHVLVNYDLPWNPMRVEQRIGRLDRLGQKADRIVIINLSLANTIEDRILRRLHRRIGIFKRSIGDLESIIGEEIGKLTRDLLTTTLTPEEEQERIDRSALAIEHRKRELDRLEKEAARFLGRDQLFEEKLREARSGGQLLAPDDLRRFFEHFLQVAYQDCDISEVGSGVHELRPSFEYVHRIRALPSAPVRDRYYARLHRALERIGGQAVVRVTFDSQRAFHDDQLEYLGPHHPAIRMAAVYFKENPETLYPAFSFTVNSQDEIDDGLYAFGLFERVERGLDERHFIEPLILNLETMVPLESDESNRLLGAMLRESRPWQSPPAPEDTARKLMQRIGELMVQREAEIQEDRRVRNQNLVQTQLATLERTHELRLEQIRDRIRTMREKRREEGVIHAMEAQIEHAKTRYRAQKAELERGLELDSFHDLFACGILSVGAPPGEGDLQ